MKTPIKFMFLLISMLLITFTSCQDEVNEETPPNQDEIIQPESNLANLMRNTSANDGSVDDIMDNSDCFTVNLPVTIVANGVTITIEAIDDLSLLEAIFDASNTDVDELEFLFPITIILNDYTQVDIESVDALNDFIDACITNEEVIECVDFVYPITFSIYNSDFQVIDTIIIDNDYELYLFLEGLDTGNNGVVIASLNFPVSLQYTNGDIIEVTSNQEMEDAISAANENCEMDCSEDYIVEILEECQWVIASYNNQNSYDNYTLFFNANQELEILNGDTTQYIEGIWDVSLNANQEIIILLSNINDTDLDAAIAREWQVMVCSENRLELIHGQDVMVLEQDCQENPFNCFQNVTVTACDFDNDGFAVFDLETLVFGTVLCNVNYSASFHISLTNAEANINAIAQPDQFTNTSMLQTIYLRIEADNGDYEVFEVLLEVEDCSNSCSVQDIDVYLQECIWNVVNFNGDNNLIMYDFDFISDSIVVITGNGMVITAQYSTSQTAEGTIIEFINVPGPNIQAITGSWLVVECAEDRVVLESINSSNTMVMEQNCSSCNNPGTLTNDLIIYMPFGNEVRDLIGGTVINDFNLAEDRAGNATCAASFNGTENFSIPVTEQNQLVQGDSFSISVWFKMQNTDVGNLELFFRKPGNATVGFNFGVYDLNTPLFFDNLNTSLWDNDWNQEVDVVWDNTDWHHIVVTVDSSNTVRLYRDGVLRTIDENSDLSIGSGPGSQYILGEGFQGHLDDLRVYKRTLSPNEVGDLYNLEADCFQCL